MDISDYPSFSTMLGISFSTLILIAMAIGFLMMFCIVIFRGGTPSSAVIYGVFGSLSMIYPFPIVNLALFITVGLKAWDSTDSEGEG